MLIGTIKPFLLPYLINTLLLNTHDICAESSNLDMVSYANY